MRRGGIHFPVPLTMNAVTRGQVARAALEGVAHAVRQNLEQAESVAGSVTDTVAVGGGMVQTRLWVEVLASVLGRAVLVPPRPQVSAVGAYLCAATALGDFGSLEEAAASRRRRDADGRADEIGRGGLPGPLREVGRSARPD